MKNRMPTERADCLGVSSAGQAILLKGLFSHGRRKGIVTGFGQRTRTSEVKLCAALISGEVLFAGYTRIEAVLLARNTV